MLQQGVGIFCHVTAGFWHILPCLQQGYQHILLYYIRVISIFLPCYSWALSIFCYVTSGLLAYFAINSYITSGFLAYFAMLQQGVGTFCHVYSRVVSILCYVTAGFVSIYCYVTSGFLSIYCCYIRVFSIFCYIQLYYIRVLSFNCYVTAGCRHILPCYSRVLAYFAMLPLNF